MNNSEFAEIVKIPAGIEYSMGNTMITIYAAGMSMQKIEILKPTATDNTQKNADALNAWFSENKDTIASWHAEKKAADKLKAQERKAFLKTSAGKMSAARDRAMALAKTAGLHEEHGSSRGDWHTLSVKDVVFTAKELKKLHASGKILALVSDFRKRVYAKCYKHAPGTREDFYLVGTNENGVSFCHSVSRNCGTVAQAVTWIWGGATITARHGDVGIAPSTLSEKTQGEMVADVVIRDSHHFSGEMHKNGSVHVRNGALHHVKNQHPDVVIDAQWQRIIVAKRAAIGGSSD